MKTSNVGIKEKGRSLPCRLNGLTTQLSTKVMQHWSALKEVLPRILYSPTTFNTHFPSGL